MTAEDKPTVTVLTTVYNGLPYLQDAIESTLNQSFKEFTYLIINDASSDREVEPFIKKYQDHRIRLITNEENLGVSETFNKALSIIDTTYVIRLDQDDISLPNRVEEQIAYLEDNPDISIVCSWEHTIDSEGNRIRDWKKTLSNYGDFVTPILLGLCPIWHPSVAFRTKDMVDAGGFDANYVRAEDFEVTSRLALKRYNASILKNFHVLQREHNDRQSIQFDEIQFETTKRIQIEALEMFLDKEKSELLSKFLRLETQFEDINKQYLKTIQSLINQLLNNMKSKLSLEPNELRSVKKNIFFRTGFGVYLSPIYTFLPDKITAGVFLIFSPMFNEKLKNKISNIINSFRKLKYKYNK